MAAFVVGNEERDAGGWGNPKSEIRNLESGWGSGFRLRLPGFVLPAPCFGLCRDKSHCAVASRLRRDRPGSGGRGELKAKNQELETEN
jgi:hypothetical protein